MELQALRYAAMISAMTFEQLVETHARYRNPAKPGFDDAKAAILEFLDWESPDDGDFGREVRILLASANFSKELTTTVLWLRDYKLDVRCIRLQPYRLGTGPVLLDVQQIIPLPETASFQTQIGVKRQAERQQRSERHEQKLEFWTELLPLAAERTSLHSGRRPTKDNWIGSPAGPNGFTYNYNIREHDSQVHLWIADNKEAFKQLEAEKSAIAEEFGRPLIWKIEDGQKGTLIGALVEGGYRSEREDWPRVQSDLVDAMVNLVRVLKPRLDRLG